MGIEQTTAWIYAALLGSLVLGIARLTVLESDRIGKVFLAICFWALGLACGAFGIYRGLSFWGYWPDSPTIMHLKHNIEQTREAADAPPTNVIIIEGGSHTARGVNTTLFERILQEQSYQVLVLQFSLPGGNHFERLDSLKRFTQALSRKERDFLLSSNLVLLREVSHTYDHNPIEQFRENVYKDRTIFYLQPDIAALAAQSILMNGGEENSVDLTDMKNIVLHGIMNALNIGVFQRSRSYELAKSRPPLFLLDRPLEGFSYTGSEAMTRDTGLTDTTGLNIPAWKRHLIDERLARLLPDCRYVFFCPPALRVGNIAYLETYRRQYPNSPVLSYAGATDLLGRLNNAAFWYDTGHMTGAGARIYTNWLALQVMESGVLAR